MTWLIIAAWFITLVLYWRETRLNRKLAALLQVCYFTIKYYETAKTDSQVVPSVSPQDGA